MSTKLTPNQMAQGVLQRPKMQRVIKAEFGDSRKVMRRKINGMLKAQNRKSEGLQLHWTFHQMAARHEYGGMKELYKYKKEVIRCGGKEGKIAIIDHVIQVFKQNEKES